MLFERINNPTNISPELVASTFTEHNRTVVQFSEPPKDPGILREVDALCGKHGDALEVRFYGHYSTVFDASVLRAIPNVQNLSLDCLTQTGPLDALFGLTKLTRLSLGIFELKDAEILEKIGIGSLREFSIGETRSTKIDLSPLAHCPHLEKAYIEAQPEGLDALQGLAGLKDLTLRRIGKNHSFAFVSNVPNLERLKVILGGRTDLDEIIHPLLKELELVWVRGLASVGDLSRFPALRSLWVEDQLQLQSINLTAAPIRLQRLVLLNCKKLTSLGTLAGLRALHDVKIGRTAISFDEFVETLPRSAATVSFWEGRRKRDAEIRAKLDGLGYKDLKQVLMAQRAATGAKD